MMTAASVDRNFAISASLPSVPGSTGQHIVAKRDRRRRRRPAAGHAGHAGHHHNGNQRRASARTYARRSRRRTDRPRSSSATSWPSCKQMPDALRRVAIEAAKGIDIAVFGERDLGRQRIFEGKLVSVRTKDAARAIVQAWPASPRLRKCATMRAAPRIFAALTVIRLRIARPHADAVECSCHWRVTLPSGECRWGVPSSPPGRGKACRGCNFAYG